MESGASEAPRIDDRLVQPETREEMVRGRRVLAPPSNPAEADQHVRLNYVLGARRKQGYVASTSLLTRVSINSDFATDTCIRQAGIDPRTGTRYLEELAFYFVNKRSLSDITERAEELTARGVRRVVAIFVDRLEVREWSPEGATWLTLDLDATFDDPTLASPLRVRDLVDADEADNAVMRALLAKGNALAVKALEEAKAAGGAMGLRAAVRSLCRALAISLTAEREAALERMSAADLDALRERIERERCWD
jgi:hypothetical protein